VALIGAVQSPGRFQVQRPTRLLELITLVNGPSAAAGDTIEIIRTLNRPYCKDGQLMPRSEASEEIVTLSLADTMKGIETANPFVRGGDIIRVVEAEPMNAYMQGSVKSTMTINLKEPVTLSQAVAMAGGLADGANSEKILIRRQIPKSVNRSDLIVSLKAIKQGKQDDILLQPNDIIDVPGPSGARKILKRVTDTLIPSLIRIPY
jgi:polysaccharide export outer membrane protein